MFQRIGRVLLAAATLSSFALAGGAGAALAADASNQSDVTLSDTGPGHQQHTGPHGEVATNVCSLAVSAGQAHCDSHVRIDHAAKTARPLPHGVAGPAGTLGNSGAYDPSYLQSAYNLTSAASGAGAGKTVAIVDAYDDPSAAKDLASYRSYFGLPPAPSFVKLNQNGSQGSYPAANSGWAQEISLDLDMVSAICPNCNILLVEANSSSFGDLATAVNTAVSHGAAAVSNSYGGSEFSGESGYDSAYNHSAVAVTVSSGDNGYGVEYPAASQYVTAVGGTSLNQASNTGSRNATESAWSGAGSGCSAYEPKPTWQTDAGCANRTVADTSAVADPNTGVWVYDAGGWYIFGGTSVASPIISSLYALAGGAGSSPTSSYPYARAADLNDVTSGSNGSCGSYLCNGGPGYDGPTGLGTPNGVTAFLPSAAANFSLALSPSSVSVLAGGSASYNVSLSSANGYSSPVSLTASGLPTGATATFSPSTVTPTNTGVSSTLSISVPAGTLSGTFPLTITATGSDPATTTHTAGASLVVSAPATPDFSLSASPASQSLPAGGGAASYSLSLTAAGGYSSAVSLAVAGLPAQATASFNPSSVTPASPAATSTLSVTVPTGVSSGSYALTITATGSDASATSHTANVTLTVAAEASYSLTATPSSQSVKAGSSGSYTVTLTGSNGYSSPVNLAVGGLPAGASGSFSANPVTPTSGGASSTLQVQTGASTPSGSFTLSVTATGTDSAAIKQTASVTLTVTVSDFTISAAQPSITVRRGSSSSDTIDLTAIGSYNSVVSLSVNGLPSRVSASFSPNPVTPTGSSTLNVKAGSHASTGTHTITITGKGSDGTTHNTTVTLTVQ